MAFPNFLSVEVKDPSKNPKSYQSDCQLLENPVLYDFCTHFSDVDSTCTPPDVQDVKYDYGDSCAKELFPHSQLDDNSPVYAKIPREIYDKILSLMQDRTTGKSSRYTWTAEEDEKLISLVKEYGPRKWSMIASELGTSKPAKQCRERYTNHLDPEIKKGDWTLEEDSHIMHYHLSFGSQWSKIAKLMKGRTANAIKNRWHGYLKKLSMKERNAIVAKFPNAIDAQALKTLSNPNNQHSTIQDNSSLGVNRIGMQSFPNHSSAQLNQGLEFGAFNDVGYLYSNHGNSLGMNIFVTEDTKPLSNSLHHYDNSENNLPFNDEFIGVNSQYLKLDSSTDTVLETEHSNDLNDFDFPSKRKREPDIFVVGKKMKMEVPPSNLDLSLIYGEDDFTSDPLFFGESTTPEGSLKRSNSDFLINKDEDDLYNLGGNHFPFTDRFSNPLFDTWPSPKECSLWSPKGDIAHSPLAKVGLSHVNYYL